MNIDLYLRNTWGRRIHVLDDPAMFVKITDAERVREHAARYPNARYCLERETGMWVTFSGLKEGQTVIAATSQDGVKIDGWGWVLKGTSLFVEV